jgi:hypothetical protein
VAVIAWIGPDVFAGIRVDGTEFQSASEVPRRDKKDVSATATAIVFTCAQAVMAHGEVAGTETAIRIGLGYEYNTAQTTDFGCTCNNQGDADGDGFLTALDLSHIIDVLFAGAEDLQDAYCSTSRYDIDCDGFPTALDLGDLIDHLFAGDDGPCDPCTP